jgi:hypothetical protein
MSSPETQIQEIKPETLEEEKLREMVRDILQNPEKYQVESRLILKIRREGRRVGCGYRYLYKDDYKVLDGEVQEVELDVGEYDCNWFEDVAIIPLTVPVIIMERYRDDDPQVSDYIIIHVFGVDGWRSLKVFVPK